MKKVMAITAIFALAFTTVAEAKRGGGMKVSKPRTTQQKSQQDADFNNTPPAQNAGAAQVQQAQGNRLGNFVTGAAAGYLLSDMLSPAEAQAQQGGEKTAEQAVTNVQNMANVPTFKQIDPTDPNLIQRHSGYSLYCLGGTQYIVSGSKAMALMDSQNQAQRCLVTAP